METYSEQIVKAYNKWMSKIEAEQYNEWHEKFKSARLASKRAGDKFENLCESEGLNYIQVAKDLMPTTIKLS